MTTNEILSILDSRKHGYEMIIEDLSKGSKQSIGGHIEIAESKIRIGEIEVITKIIKEHQAKNMELQTQKLNSGSNE